MKHLSFEKNGSSLNVTNKDTGAEVGFTLSGKRGADMKIEQAVQYWSKEIKNNKKLK